ncbi:DMT family transporter [Aquifex aeolicus]|uniref:EamA domain-containing protein n=1 Tax=Aquifex aeolicus (strain VF5) TaxID=224324 RepID=O66609_AQUAE|nr:DMT family transporter [Aquifex aeolicus]AAC06571.1 putative protein [Aquifex aeolicus VF5]
MEYNHLLGITFSLFSAFFWATNDIFNKKLILKGYEENFVLWIRFPLGALLLLPFGLVYWDLNETVIKTTFLWLPSEILASIFFIKSLKYAPLSLAMPFYATMPAFSALAGWIVLGEVLSLRNWLGILLIVYGTTLLAGKNIKSFFTLNKGVLYALFSSFLFGVNVVIGKIAVVSSNQFFFSWYYCLVMSLALIPFVKRFEVKDFSSDWKFFGIVGLFFSLGMVFYTWAYIYTYASFVAATERLAILLDVLYGKVFFGEKVKNAFKASIIMVLGVFLLSL